MTETQIITKKIKPYLESLGAMSVKYHGGPFGQSGVSDLIVCHFGKYVALEIKKPGNKPTALQLRFIEQVKEHGGLAGVVYTDSFKEDILNILYAKETKPR